ncbi:MAG: hypothetical protein HZA91_08990 [Verrucomicrobia bacterium]|nr:hypothetical protein [Verrucomicrobiota bacterium]
MKETHSFWEGKEPCWELMGCSKLVAARCPAYLRPERACWEHPVTECEKVLGAPRDCPRCRVYARYHGAVSVRPNNS